MKLRHFLSVLFLLVPPLPGYADGHLPAALTCIDGLEQGGSWDMCRAMIFEPCQDHSVGSEPHLSCLRGEQAQWVALRDSELAGLVGVLTADATENMADLMEHWYVSVATKCDAVAAERAGISAQAAVVGCDISETAGLTSALRQCRLGQSNAEFCVRED